MIGIVVPDIDYIREYFKNPNLDLKTFCSDQSSKQLIMNDLEQIGKNSGLMSYEKVKKIHLHPELMSLENGLATPTMKIKRVQVRIFFNDVIKRLYDQPADSKINSKI